MNLSVYVSLADIRAGDHSFGRNNAVARAVTRRLREVYECSVLNELEIVIWHKRGHMVYSFVPERRAFPFLAKPRKGDPAAWYRPIRFMLPWVPRGAVRP